MFLHCRTWLSKIPKQLFLGASASSGRLTNLCRQLKLDELHVRSSVCHDNVFPHLLRGMWKNRRLAMGWLMRALSQWRFSPESQLVSRCATRRGSARNMRAHGCSSLRSPCSTWRSQDPKRSRCHQCTVSFKVQLVICGCASCLSFADKSDHLTSVQNGCSQNNDLRVFFFLMDRPSFRSCLPFSAASPAGV